jgi:hypothetical protein
MDMRRLLGLNFVWEFGQGLVLDLSWTCLRGVMIAPNAEVGKSVATSFAQLLSSRTHSVACAARAYRNGVDGDWTAQSRFPKSLKL